MIERHRRKLIFDMMLFVITLLVIAIVLLVYATYRYEDNQLTESMTKVLEIDERSTDGDGTFYNNFVSSYTGAMSCSYIDADGTISSTVYLNSKMPYNKSEIIEAVSEAMSESEETGVLSAYSLKYMRSELVSGGYKLVLADRTGLVNDVQFILRLYIVFGFLSMFALLGLSEFMVSRAMLPVEQSLKDQQRFIADASHELKTPLTVIMANLDIIQSDPEKKVSEVSKWVSNTQSEASRMRKLVSEMMFLARSDAEINQNYQFDMMNLSDVLDECVLTSEALAFENNINLESDIEENVLIIGDKDKIKQVILILLDNAFKYVNPNGSVTITLKTVNGRLPKLQVINTGSLIPAEKVDFIFDRFYRVDESRVREKGGYGLGLSIARDIVLKHNAQISVPYSDERGTCFEIAFPTLLSARSPIISEKTGK